MPIFKQVSIACVIVAGVACDSFAQVDTSGAAPANTAAAVFQPLQARETVLNPGFAASVSPDPFTGALGISIPLQLPVRAPVQPSLSLVYSSSGGNGDLGVGWQLDFPIVERRSQNGVDYDRDDFVYRVGGALQRLAPVGEDEFRLEIESDFTRLRKVEGPTGIAWEVTSADGRKQMFGEARGAVISDPGRPQRVLQWRLTSVTDLHGNRAEVSYVTDPGGHDIHPHQIVYGGRHGTQHPFALEFIYEGRPDLEVSFVGGFRIASTLRLKAIAAKAGGALTNVYAFSYDKSSQSNRSILVALQQLGSDAVLGDDGTFPPQVQEPTSHPPYRFEWYSRPAQFASADISSSAGIELGQQSGRTWTDFNGDGFSDFCRVVGNTLRCLSGGATGFGAEISSPPIDPGLAEGRAWVDVNGDGRRDFCRAGVHLPGTTANRNIACVLSTATGFGQEKAATDVRLGFGDSRSWADIDGDGSADFCTLVGGAGAPTRIVCRRSTDAGFGAEIVSSPLVGGPVDSRGWVDFNGDGKADFCRAVISSGNQIVSCLVSHGSSFGTDVPSGAIAWGQPQGRAWVDYNRDGKSDFCRLLINQGIQQVACELSTGSGFETRVESATLNGGLVSGRGWGDVSGDGAPDYCRVVGDPGTRQVRCISSNPAALSSELPGVSLANYATSTSSWTDVNGDGVYDFCRVDLQGAWRCRVSMAFPGDLVKTVASPIGGRTTVSYEPSTRFTNRQLPVAFPVVSAIAVSDGIQPASTWNYRYSGGFFYIGEVKEFRGFAHVDVTGPARADGVQTIVSTDHHQGSDVTPDRDDPTVAFASMRGKPYRTRITSSDGRTYRVQTLKYKSDVERPWFHPLESNVETACDEATGCSHSTRVEYEYDAFGNRTAVVDFRDVDDPVDDRVVTTRFDVNADRWILSLPASSETFAGIANRTKVNGVEYFYDGPADCPADGALGDSRPTVGDLTAVRVWDPTQPPIVHRLGHDSRGNVVCRRDAAGHLVRSGYDPTGLVEIESYDALAHKTEKRYAGINAPASPDARYGQLVATVDPNRTTTSYTYDKLGRTIRVSSMDPDGASVFSRFEFKQLGVPGEQNVTTRSSSGLSKVDVLDGLGRAIRSESTGPQQQQIVSTTTYDSHGRVSRETGPAYAGSSTPPARTFSYDPIGRIMQSVDEQGKKTASCYGARIMAEVDAGGYTRVRRMDGAGRVVSLEEAGRDVQVCNAGILSAPAQTRVLSKYAYDVVDNLIKIDGPTGASVSFTYDARKHRTKLSSSDADDVLYTYDADGLLIGQTSASQRPHFYTYDANHRLIQDDVNERKPVSRGDLTYVWDGGARNIGRRTEIRYQSSVEQFQYDFAGRQISATRHIGSSTYVTRAAFDDANRVTRVEYPDGRHTTYHYDGPFLATIRRGSDAVVTYTGHSASGVPRETTFRNGVVEEIQLFDGSSPGCPGSSGRLCRYRLVPVSGAAIERAYSYDDLGNVFQVKSGDHVEFHLYDVRGRLAAIARGAAADEPAVRAFAAKHRWDTGQSYWDAARATLPSIEWREGYGYNESGSVSWSSFTGTYQYPSVANRQPHAVSRVGNVAYGYDGSGNTVSSLDRGYRYDEWGRLVSITRPDSTASIVYGGGGDLQSITANGATSVRVGDLYRCDTDSAGQRCTTAIVSGGTRIALLSDSGDEFLHRDYGGSVVATTDRSGRLLSQFSYSAYGVLRGASGGSPSFAGMELEPQLGLYYAGARFYNQEIGRFVTPDEVVGALGVPESIDPYQYAFGNPTMRSDSGGTFPAALVPIIAGALISGTQAVIRGENFLTAVALGAVSGAIVGAAAPLIQVNAYLGYAAAGAASGAVVTAARRGDIGLGALMGAALGAANVGLGELGLFGAANPSSGFLGYLAASSARGALLSAAYATATGGDIGTALLRGARDWAAAGFVNTFVGHVAGSLRSGKEPRWDPRAGPVFDARPDGTVSFGGLSGKYSTRGLSIGFGISGRGLYDANTPASMCGASPCDVLDHEISHQVHSTWLGPAYLPLHLALFPFRHADNFLERYWIGIPNY